jgi:alcohol dehydrogenase YqhD (iron-dependent ADH family)
MMMHTIERYFGIGKGTDFVDRLGEATLQAIIRSGAMAMAEPQSYEARANLMWAGSITHNGLTGTGRICDFVCHQLEHEMSALYDVAHGAGLAVVFPAWARYVLDTDVMRFAQYAVRVWGCQMDFEEPRRTALEGIRRTEDFFKSIGMPVTFKELGMTGSQIPEMAEKCTFFGKRKVGTCFRPLEEEDIRAIFERAKGE